MTNVKVQFKADLMLLLITVFWGASNLLMKIALNSMQEFNLISLRFIIAFFLACIVFYRHLIKVDFKTIKYAFILASILFFTYVSVTYGVKYTSVSNAGFLTSLTVTFIPILSSIFFKQKPDKKVVFAICLAIVGISIMTINNKLTIAYGDLLCILCAFLYAVYIIVTEMLTKSVNSIALGILQLGFVGLFSTIFTISMERPKIPNTFEAWFSVLVLSIFCTAIAFIIQTTAQQYTSSTRAGIIFSLEPVFSAILAFFFAGEILTLKCYIGALLLLLSVLIVELDFKKLLNVTTIYKKIFFTDYMN